MAGENIQPGFKGLVALQNDLAKGSLDPSPKAEQLKEEQVKADQARKDDATKGKKTLSISLYQDPRDQLDQERHAKLAKAREEART